MIYWFSGWRPAEGMVIGIDYAVGPLGAGMASLAGVLASAALIYCWRYFDSARGRHHALVLIFLAGSVDFCLTGDLFNLFVAFELVAVTAYALTGYNAGYPGPLQGAINFAVTNSLGGMSVLMGIGFLYARTGSLNLAQIGQVLSGRHADGLIVVAFALLTGGFLVKAAVVPFHFWLPDAYGSAPIPVCVLFAGVMSELGLFAVIRVWVTVFSGLRRRVRTADAGGAARLRDPHGGRRRGHGTGPAAPQADAGLRHHEPPGHLPDRAGLLTPLGLAGASLLVIGDGLAKSALFLGVGAVQHRWASVSETRLRGRGRGLAVTGVTIVAGALVLAGLPPYVSSAAHALLAAAADQAGLPWLDIVIAVCVIASSGAVLRAAARIWLGWGYESPDAGTGTADDPGEEAAGRSDTDTDTRTATGTASAGQDQDRPERSGKQRRVPLTMLLPPLALLATGLGLGLTSGIEEHAAAAAAAFSDRAAYAAAVLGTGAVPSPREAASSSLPPRHRPRAVSSPTWARCLPRSAWRASPWTGGPCGSAGHWPRVPDGCAACTAASSVTRSPG